jgi:hypothetical protein
MSTPKGAVPAYALHGRPAVEARLAHIENARIASASAEYVGRGPKCIANEDTCEGARAKGTEYCVGHLRSAMKNKEVVNGADTTNEG